MAYAVFLRAKQAKRPVRTRRGSCPFKNGDAIRRNFLYHDDEKPVEGLAEGPVALPNQETEAHQVP